MSLRYLVVKLIKKLAQGRIIKRQSMQSAIYEQYPDYVKQWKPK
jgi:hypothetical protein